MVPEGAAIVAQSDPLKMLKQTEAHTYQTCSHCKRSILKGERYYREYIVSERLLLPRKQYCVTCAPKQSPVLLNPAPEGTESSSLR